MAATVALATIAGSLALGAEPASAYTTRTWLGRGPGVPWITMIGDSTLSGVRWTNNYWPLERFNYTFDAESCRRTLAPSCRGREGYAPQTALQTMQRLHGSLGQVVIMMTGYNDPGTGFPAAVDAIVAEARRQGLQNVIWLTMRTADVTYVSPTYRSNSYTFRDNNRILLQKAEQYGGFLQIADWATHSATQRSWVGGDGVHLTSAGAVAVTTFAAEMASQVFSGVTITPRPTSSDGWVNLRKGDRGAVVANVQNALVASGARLVGGADGIYGIYTERAVAAFQSRLGLAVNGVVDSNTARALGIVVSGVGASVAPPLEAWANVARGSRGAAVVTVQQAVMNAGIFLRGGADGVFGAYTHAAVTTYQQQRGLAASGVVDESTAVAMGLWSGAVAAAPVSWVDVAQGARGPSVVAIQRAVINAGIFLRGGADGVFGNYTRGAVAAYQQQRGLPASGVVDEATAIAMGLYTQPVPTTTTTTTAPTTTTTAVPATLPPTTEATTTVAPTTTAAATTTSVAATTTLPPATTTTTTIPTTTTVPAETTTTAPAP